MSENVQLASVLMGSRSATSQPISSRKNTPPQASQASEGRSIESDADNTARDSASDRKQTTSFDKVLSKRLERKPDETTSDAAPSQEPSGNAQLNPEAELTLAKILAQFNRSFETSSADAAGTSAQQNSTPAGSLAAQAQSAATAAPKTATMTPQASADSQAGAQPAQTTDEALFSQSDTPKDQASAANTAELLGKTAPAGESKAAADKPMAPEASDKQLTGQPAAEKGAAAPQTVDPSLPAAKDAAPQVAANKPVADSANGQVSNPESQADPAKALQAKDDGKPDASASSADRRAFDANTTELSAASNTQNTAAAATAAQTSVQPKVDVVEMPEKPAVSVAETSEVSRIRASDPVAASRTVDQISQKLSLEQPVRVDQQIRLTLSPQELGAVRVTFREQGGEIVGLLEVQKSQTRKEIEDSMPQLLSSMQGQGVQVRRIEVVQWNAPQQQSRDSLSDNANPSAERELLQQQAGQSGGGSSHQRGFGRSDGFSADVPDRPGAGGVDTPEWFSDKGLNLYI